MEIEHLYNVGIGFVITGFAGLGIACNPKFLYFNKKDFESTLQEKLKRKPKSSTIAKNRLHSLKEDTIEAMAIEEKSKEDLYLLAIQLSEQGIKEEEIAEKLQLGVTEVHLILKLKKNGI